MEATVLSGNIEGLLTRNKKYKVGMLAETMRESNTVVAALCETHLREEILDAEINVEGYRIYRSDRLAGMRKGGVLMYVREDVAADMEVLSSGSTGEAEWLVVWSKQRKMLNLMSYHVEPFYKQNNS